METLNLSKIISLNNNDTTTILYESMQPYLKSLYIYYKDLFCCEPIIMVTDVFNAAQYAKIVPSNDFNEAISLYLDSCELSEEEKEAASETINFNSKMLINLI